MKGRMPEPSEWLVAEGGAIETLGIATPHLDALEEREYHLPRRMFSLHSNAFLLMTSIPGITLTLHPG